MIKQQNRARILMTPYPESDATGRSHNVLTDLPRMIRRHELRLVVPLADSTIYEMEKRGEFPRRFNLTPRCVVWSLEEVTAWLQQRRTDSLTGRIKRAAHPDVRLRRTRQVRS